MSVPRLGTEHGMLRRASGRVQRGGVSVLVLDGGADEAGRIDEGGDDGMENSDEGRAAVPRPVWLSAVACGCLCLAVPLSGVSRHGSSQRATTALSHLPVGHRGWWWGEPSRHVLWAACLRCRDVIQKADGTGSGVGCNLQRPPPTPPARHMVQIAAKPGTNPTGRHPTIHDRSHPSTRASLFLLVSRALLLSIFLPSCLSLLLLACPLPLVGLPPIPPVSSNRHLFRLTPSELHAANQNSNTSSSRTSPHG